MYTFYLPKLGSKFEQFSFLSGRVSRRQKVRLQGRPGTGEMTGEKRNRDFKCRSRRKKSASVTAVSNELALRKVCEHLTPSAHPGSARPPQQLTELQAGNTKLLTDAPAQARARASVPGQCLMAVQDRALKARPLAGRAPPPPVWTSRPHRRCITRTPPLICRLSGDGEDREGRDRVLHMPHHDLLNQRMNKDSKTCLLQSYFGGLQKRMGFSYV